MSYPYVDRSIEPPLLVIESGDRVMPGISTPIGEKANPSPICPSFSCRMNVCFPPPPSMLSHSCPFSVWSFHSGLSLCTDGFMFP
jgi:hypothetical protein